MKLDQLSGFLIELSNNNDGSRSLSYDGGWGGMNFNETFDLKTLKSLQTHEKPFNFAEKFILTSPSFSLAIDFALANRFPPPTSNDHKSCARRRLCFLSNCH